MINRLVDKYGRRVDSFRLSITSRCNYNCIFCHREGIAGNRDELLSPEDYGFLAKVGKGLGINKYKLTGGEPLVREDIEHIVSAITENAPHVSITTNGSLLFAKAKKLAESQVEYINVSLHSLNPVIYSYITQVYSTKLLDVVLRGIDAALSHGLKVKLNFLLMKINAGEFRSILDYASSRGLDINIIELIPLGTPPGIYASQHAALDPVVEYLEKIAVRKDVREFQNRPEYVLPAGNRAIVIKGYGNPHLCARCTRLRLTPDGKIKTCIFVKNKYVDILDDLKRKDEVSLIKKMEAATLMREPYFKFR